MSWLLFVVAALFCLFGAVCLVLILLQLPGGWLLYATALVIELVDGLWLDPPETTTFGWLVLVLCLLVLTIGEIIEVLASAAGAHHGGATRRGMIGALVGAIVGAIVLTPLLPIPVIGTLVGAVAGTFAGAILGELTRPETVPVRDVIRPAVGASAGRVAGTVAKLGLSVAVWITLSVAAFWP